MKAEVGRRPERFSGSVSHPAAFVCLVYFVVALHFSALPCLLGRHWGVEQVQRYRTVIDNHKVRWKDSLNAVQAK